jgi:hypothetical protein
MNINNTNFTKQASLDEKNSSVSLPIDKSLWKSEGFFGQQVKGFRDNMAKVGNLFHTAT